MARRLRLRFVSDADAKQLMVNRRIGQSLDSGSDSASHSDPEGDEDKKKGICEVKDKKFAGNEIPNQVLPSCSRLTQAEQGDVQNYFEAHRNSKVCTSNRTLSCLRSAHLDQDRLLGLLADLPPVFLKERQALKEGYRHLFSKWLLQLRLGFNVLLYGLGSKRCLLDDFRLTALHDESHVVLDGSFPNVTLNSVLTLILEEILELPVPCTSVEQLEAVKRSFGTEGACELFLLVHNVDGPTLRASRTQEWFAQLATLPGIHIIATIDHVNAPLVWDQGRAGQFRWLWFDVPTFEAYTEETAYEKSLLVHSSGTLVLSSLRHVLRSLTPNARGIFALLAQYQLKHKDTTSYPGLSFQSCYQQCREAFLVSSDIALRAQLTEFLDHRLVRTKKGSDGVEYLSIPIDTSTLRDFLDSQKET